MNDAVILDQADEETLTYDVSDETLEAAAVGQLPGQTALGNCTIGRPYGCPSNHPCPWS